MDGLLAALAVSIAANLGLLWLLWRWHRIADNWEGLALYWRTYGEQQAQAADRWRGKWLRWFGDVQPEMD